MCAWVCAWLWGSPSEKHLQNLKSSDLCQQWLFLGSNSYSGALWDFVVFSKCLPFLFIYLYSVSVLRTQNGNTVISPTAESGGVEINIPGKWYRRRRFCCVFVVISQSSNLSASHRGRGGSALSTPWSDWLQEAQPIISLRPDPHWDLAGERPSFNSSLKHVSNMSCSTTWEYYLCSQRWPYLSVPSLLHICLHGCSRLSFG